MGWEDAEGWMVDNADLRGKLYTARVSDDHSPCPVILRAGALETFKATDQYEEGVTRRKVQRMVLTGSDALVGLGHSRVERRRGSDGRTSERVGLPLY